MLGNFLSKTVFSVICLFVVTTTAFVIVGTQLDAIHIKHGVVIGANTLLFLITIFNSWMHAKAAKNPNPHVFSRSIMAATAIKLFALGGAAIIYLFVAACTVSFSIT
jgi:hypothetical protein